MTEGYAELHAHTNFSFLDGAAHPEELAAMAAARGLTALAVTDHGGLYAMVRFTAAARHVGLRALIGAELTVEAMPGIETPEPQLLVDPLATTKPRERQRGRHHLTVLARDGTGFSNLTRMLSHSNLGAPPSDRKGYTAVAWELLTEHTAGLIVLSGCKRMGLIPRLLRAGRREAAAEAAARLRELFDVDGGAGDFLLELQNHMVPEDPWTCAELAELGRDTGIPCVATNDVHMMTPQDKPLQDVLVAIRERGTLDEMEAQGLLAPNAERHVKTRAEMEEALLGPGATAGVATSARAPSGAIVTEPWLRRTYMEALDRTVEVAGRCDFELDLRSKRFPGFPVPEGETPFSYLYELCQEGVKIRYRPMTSVVARRLQTELEVIEKTGLAEFFLINWDLMRFAKESGIPGQGRGSAADSIVAYLLGITRVDPVEHNLLFERFLHEEQKTTPDIDIDFASSRREEVIQYIYEKYGADRSGMVANVVTFRPRMAIRQVGKALGFSPATIDRLAKSADSWYPEEAMAAAEAAGLGEVRAAPVEGGPELSRDRVG
ncbi:MAG: PHP domain-containing protein [Candidatus Dormiibacterota bacterium]